MYIVCTHYLESPHWGGSNEYTQYTIFNIKKKKSPLIIPNLQPMYFFLRTQEQVLNSRDKQAISIGATEVLLYMV